MGKAFIYKQIPLNLAWDQAPHCGKKKKKTALAKKTKLKSTSEANQEVVWGGERVVALPPSPGYRWARFARRYFSYLTPSFLALFSPTAEPGPRLVLTNSLRKCVRDCNWILGHIRLNYFFLGVGRLSRVMEKPASILTSLLGFSRTHPCSSDIVSDLLPNFFNSLLK